MSLDVRPDRTRPGDDAPQQPTHPEPHHATAGRSGGGGTWLIQVGTGVALLVLVVVHLVAQHFVVDAPGGLRDHAAVLDYLANPLLLVVEVAFLVAVTWHAMLGLRSIALDLGPGPAMRRRVTIAVAVLGGLTLVYGLGLLVVLLA